MGRLSTFLADNAVDLLFNLAAFLIVYLIARAFKAGPLVALCFAVLPLLIAYIAQHPTVMTRVLSMLP